MQLTDVQEIKVTRMVRATLAVETDRPGFTDLTGALMQFLTGAGAGDGLLSIFLKHTSASLTIQENADPDVRSDLLDALGRLAPQGAGYRHHTEGPDDMPAHIRTMLTDVEFSVPVARGRLGLGTWQSVYLLEHRAQPHSRAVNLTYLGT